MKVGDKVIIYEKNTNNCIDSGIIKTITNNPRGISLDNLLFYNPNSFIIEKLKSNIDLKDYNHCILDKSKYIYYNHNNIDNTFVYDLFEWNPIELEVKETVDLLNSLGFLETYSSCSGHNIIPSYIDFKILDSEKFYFFIDFLNKNGIYSYTYKHQEIEDPYIRFLLAVEGHNTCHLELINIDSSFERLNKVIKGYKKCLMY